jgi:hypothetical protein
VPGPLPDRIALVGALAALPARQRRAVVLHHIGGLSTAEIAEQEGVAEGTVRSWLSRGRAALAAGLADTDGGFRPAPLSQVQEAVRRRRRGRVAAAGAAVLAVLAVPVLMFGLRDGTPPTPTQSSPPAVTTPTFETRPIRVTGFPVGTVWNFSFTDAEHGWAWTRCDSDTCRFGLAVTSDGGRTWRPVSVPAQPSGVAINVYPLDGETVTLNIITPGENVPDSFLLTTNGGATFSSYPQQSPPVQALQAESREQHREGWTLFCPGQTGFLDGAAAPECDRQVLSRIGSGPVNPQPQVGGIVSYIEVGGDGRIWLINDEPGLPRLQVSADGARRWQVVADPPALHDLALSPDGSDVWVISETGIYRLVGGAWLEQGVDLNGAPTYAVTALDDGILVIPSPRGITIFQNGVQRPLPGSPVGPDRLTLLPDGTLAGYDADSEWLGIGTALDRTWVRIKRES